MSTISRPQLLQTHLLGAQPPEPEASERGEEDGESGADDEQESSSAAASGLTWREKEDAAAGAACSVPPPRFRPWPPSVAGPSGKPSLGRGSSQKRQPRQPDPAPLSRRPAGHSPPFTPAAALTSPGSPALFLLRAVAAAAAPAARPHSSAMSAGSCGDRADEEPLSAAGRGQK